MNLLEHICSVKSVLSQRKSDNKIQYVRVLQLQTLLWKQVDCAGIY